ncbi:MAG TPA: tetratricopeptide repeat protein [archaeon]|nr:tetratricopeptide repeat protein [archaeon]
MTESGFQNFFSRRSFRYLSVLIVTLAVYLSILGADFVQWDDRLVTENLALRGLSLEHLRGITLPHGAAYQPVRNLVFALIYQFSKLDPFGYHLVNLLLYLLAVGLAFRVLEVLVKLTPGDKASRDSIPWIGAALFALHPLHVEGVAWIIGNKDLLVTVFFLSAFISYEKYTRTPRGLRYYWLAYILFLLALGSKPTAAAFPLVILAFDLIFRQTGKQKKPGSGLTTKALVFRHFPYWLPAALLAVYFIFYTSAMERSKLDIENILVIPEILWDYYRLTLLPVGLLHRYLDPEFRGLGDPAFLAGLFATAAIIYFLLRKRREYPLVSFGISWFYLCWLPQSNIVPIIIRVADRYIFLSLLGFSLAAAILLTSLLQRAKSAWSAVAVRVSIILLCAALAVMSAKRCLTWRDGETLWLDGAAKVPHSGYFLKGLANVYLEREELDRSYAVFQKAVSFAPLDAGIWNNMGYIRKKQGRAEEAANLYRQAIAIDSTNLNSLNSLGNIYAELGKDSLAIIQYLKVLKIRPNHYMAASNLATVYRKLGRKEQADRLMQQLENTSLPQPVVLLKRGMVFIQEGRLDSARERFERALSLDRDLVAAYANLGEIYLRQDSLDQALNHFKRVLREVPPDWPLYNNLGQVFDRLGKADSAVFYYRKAYELEPDSSSSTLSLGVALSRLNKTEEAVALVERFLQNNPGNALANYNLGNWLVRLGKFPEAAGYYRRALAINPNDTKSHLNLGLVCLQFLNQPEAALEHLEQAIRLDPNQPQAARIKETINYLKSLR